ncbi:MAG: DUF22 domain-containing protein [Candidatus Thorarchaeota archaeon]|jgi:hypothetical protein
MAEKIYVISCSSDLASMGMDRIRRAAEGLEEITGSFDWNNVIVAPVIAAEKVPVDKGDSTIISIEPIEIPAFAAVMNSYYGTNGMGFASCIGSMEFKTHSEKRVADKAMFHSHIKAPILPGDLVGQVMIVPGQKK